MISESATLLYAAKRDGIIKPNVHFWREYSSADKLKNISLDLDKYAREIQNSGVNLICSFDRDFPPLPVSCKPSEKPYLFAYRGDISLLKDRAKNFAVVGSLTPTDKILHRENAHCCRIDRTRVSYCQRTCQGLRYRCPQAVDSFLRNTCPNPQRAMTGFDDLSNETDCRRCLQGKFF